MKLFALLAVVLLAGCAAGGPLASAKPDDCRAEVAQLKAQLAVETAERQRSARAASRREETLRRQLEAMKSIERGILERDDRMRTETR
jgi:outer membrane murein-binding lipoprotein Lpp